MKKILLLMSFICFFFNAPVPFIKSASSADIINFKSIAIIRSEDFYGNFRELKMAVYFSVNDIDSFDRLTLIDPDGNIVGVSTKTDFITDPIENSVTVNHQLPLPPLMGTYTITVTPTEGLSQTFYVDTMESDIPTETPVITFPDYPSKILYDTTPTFTWESFPCERYSVFINSINDDEMWRFYTQNNFTTSTKYNSDGNAVFPVLPQGEYYFELYATKNRGIVGSIGHRNVDFYISDNSTTTTIPLTTTTTVSSSVENTKAVIVSGGGETKNNLWDVTWALTNLSYKVLKYQGFTSDNIYYLNCVEL